MTSANLICPSFSVVHDFREFRTSIFDRNGRVVIRNATATYTVGEGPNTRVYDVSDAQLIDGERVPRGDRHGSTSVKLPAPTETHTEFGREAKLLVSVRGPLGGFDQQFVGYSKKDFLIIYTSFASGVKCPAKLLRLSPLEVDGAKQPWSSEAGALYIAGRTEDVAVESPDGSFQTIRDLRSNRMLFTGILHGAVDIAPRAAASGEPPECNLAGQTSRTTFAEPGVTEGVRLRDHGRTGLTAWSVEQMLGGGAIIDTSSALYPMAALFLDLSNRVPDKVEADFRFAQERYRPQEKFPFDLPILEPSSDPATLEPATESP